MVRIMIMATMHDITTTTMSELRMENQCTCMIKGGWGVAGRVPAASAGEAQGIADHC